MSNVETAPAELVCGGDAPRVEVVEPRAVPLDEADRRFGAFPDSWVSTLPAPELPNARLRPRG